MDVKLSQSRESGPSREEKRGWKCQECSSRVGIMRNAHKIKELTKSSWMGSGFSPLELWTFWPYGGGTRRMPPSAKASLNLAVALAMCKPWESGLRSPRLKVRPCTMCALLGPMPIPATEMDPYFLWIGSKQAQEVAQLGKPTTLATRPSLSSYPNSSLQL